MSLMRLFAVLLLLIVPVTAGAQAHDPAAPCGRDSYGNPLPCHSVRENMLEATCMTSANPYYCLPYHQRACQVSGFASACRLAEIGQHCYGGNAQNGQYYQSILRANTDCNVNGNPNACNWLVQQNL